jgi:hypothetical protein
MAKKSVNDPESLGWTDDGNGFWSWSDGGSAESAVLQDREEDQQVVSKFTFTGTPEENGMGFTNVPNKFVVDTESQKATFQYGLDNSALPDAMNPWNVTVEGSLTTSSTGFPFSLITYDAFGIKKSPKDFGAASASILHRYADDSPERWIVKPNLEVEGDGTFSGSVTASDYLDADGNSIVGGTGGGSSLWEQNGDNIYYNDGKVGIGTDDPQAGLHVDGEVLVKTDDGASATINVESSSNQAAVNLKTPDGGFKISTEKAESDPAASFKIIDRTDGFRNRLVIDAAGSVGIGMDPEVVTFDLSAKEQLKEWKTKAKKASWPIVTDGAFEQEPTEDLVEQWIETRAAGDKLQVKGNISATGSVTAQSDVRINSSGTNNPRVRYNGLTAGKYFAIRDDDAGVDRLKISNTGDATFSGPITAGNLNISDNSIYRTGQAGLFFGTTSGTSRVILPTNSSGAIDDSVSLSLGSGTNKFASAHFSGTVQAKVLEAVNRVTATKTGLDAQGVNSSSTISLLPDIETHVPELKTYGGGSTGNNGFKITARKADDQITLLEFARNTGDATFYNDVNINGDLLASKPDAGANAFAAGLDAGKTNQGGGAVAIGKDAGFEYQKPESVAVGHKAGYQNQGGGGVGIGFLAGAGDQGEYSIAIGYQASYDKQGEKSIAIGYMAGGTEQGDGSIVIKGGLGRQGGFRKEPNNISLSTSTGSLTYNGTDAWTFDGGTVNGLNGFRQNGAPVIDAKGLISTLSTLRNATKDETTLEGLRDSIGNAIGGLIEKFEAEIAAMPAPETGTMETLQ